MAEVKIEVTKNGPYLVRGPVTIMEGGRTVEAKDPAALCRCGASTKKPFCDGTHSKIGFNAAAAAVPESKE
jgi:CDGSH-type Zn-finger protein